MSKLKCNLEYYWGSSFYVKHRFVYSITNHTTDSCWQIGQFVFAVLQYNWMVKMKITRHDLIRDVVRRVWRYQRGNQKPYIEEEQTTQWPKEKVQKDKQRSTKHTYRTKDRVTRTPLKTAGELRCSGRVSSSCFTRGIRRVNLVTNPIISREWGKDREVFTTSGTYPWSFVTQIFHNG